MNTETIVSLFAAVAAWAAVGFDEHRRRQDRGHLIGMDHSRLATDRQRFWSITRQAFVDFRRLNQSQDATTLDDLIDRAAPPGGLPLPPYRHLRDWPASHLQTLSTDERRLWAFASSLYCAEAAKPGEGPLSTLLAGERLQEFHESRGNLARAWNAWARIASVSYFKRNHRAARRELVLLAWLELPLVQQTRDDGPGKSGMFAIASGIANA